MDAHHRDDPDAQAERSTRIIRHLDGALDTSMLDAMSGVWSMLEHAAADAPSHARAVRARLFWESLTPGGTAAAPIAIVHDLQPSWDDADELDGDIADAA